MKDAPPLLHQQIQWKNTRQTFEIESGARCDILNWMTLDGPNFYQNFGINVVGSNMRQNTKHKPNTTIYTGMSQSNAYIQDIIVLNHTSVF